MPFTAAEAYQLLQRAQSQDRLAHAYLLTGPVGSGKRDLAARACALLLGEPVADFQHPDIHLLEPESKSRRILIEQLHELEHHLRLRSFLGGRKIGVVVDADRLHPNAANAFLKTLEEPPARGHLLLLSSQPEQVLEKILSRCLEIPLRSVEVRTVTPLQQRLLATLQAHARQAAPGLAPAFGIVREFQTLLAEARDAIQTDADAELSREEKHYKQTTESKSWLDDREDYYKALVQSRYIAVRQTLLDTLDQWWADALRQKTSPETGAALLDHPDLAGETASLAQQYTATALLGKVAALEKLRGDLSAIGVQQEQLAFECAFLRAFGE